MKSRDIEAGWTPEHGEKKKATGPFFKPNDPGPSLGNLCKLDFVFHGTGFIKTLVP